jgi:hypothetical protein
MIDWSQLVEQAGPAAVSTLVVSALMLFLNHRASLRLESYKTELERQLANERARLEEIALRRSVWYEKRSVALVDLYGAFYKYLDFLRLHFYFGNNGRDVSAVHEFRKTCDTLSIFLTDELKKSVDGYAFELLQFWNWAQENRETEQDEIRRRLDFEIPRYLELLRIDIGRYLEEVPPLDDEPTSK